MFIFTFFVGMMGLFMILLIVAVIIKLLSSTLKDVGDTLKPDKTRINHRGYND